MAKVEPMTILVDTREQIPLIFSNNVTTETVTLETGDYTARGVSEVARIELKRKGDFISCVTTSRERFLSQMERLSHYPVRALVVAASWHELSRGLYRSRVSSLSVTGTLLAVMVDWQIPVLLVDDERQAAAAVERILRRVARKAAEERAA